MEHTICTRVKGAYFIKGVRTTPAGSNELQPRMNPCGKYPNRVAVYVGNTNERVGNINAREAELLSRFWDDPQRAQACTVQLRTEEPSSLSSQGYHATIRFGNLSQADIDFIVNFIQS